MSNESQHVRAEQFDETQHVTTNEIQNVRSDKVSEKEEGHTVSNEKYDVVSENSNKKEEGNIVSNDDQNVRSRITQGSEEGCTISDADTSSRRWEDSQKQQECESLPHAIQSAGSEPIGKVVSGEDRDGDKEEKKESDATLNVNQDVASQEVENVGSAPDSNHHKSNVILDKNQDIETNPDNDKEKDNITSNENQSVKSEIIRKENNDDGPEEVGEKEKGNIISNEDQDVELKETDENEKDNPMSSENQDVELKEADENEKDNTMSSENQDVELKEADENEKDNTMSSENQDVEFKEADENEKDNTISNENQDVEFMEADENEKDNTISNENQDVEFKEADENEKDNTISNENQDVEFMEADENEKDNTMSNENQDVEFKEADENEKDNTMSNENQDVEFKEADKNEKDNTMSNENQDVEFKEADENDKDNTMSNENQDVELKEVDEKERGSTISNENQNVGSKEVKEKDKTISNENQDVKSEKINEEEKGGKEKDSRVSKEKRNIGSGEVGGIEKSSTTTMEDQDIQSEEGGEKEKENTVSKDSQNVESEEIAEKEKENTVSKDSQNAEKENQNVQSEEADGKEKGTTLSKENQNVESEEADGKERSNTSKENQNVDSEETDGKEKDNTLSKENQNVKSKEADEKEKDNTSLKENQNVESEETDVKEEGDTLLKEKQDVGSEGMSEEDKMKPTMSKENQDVESKEINEKEKASTISIENQDVEPKDVGEKDKTSTISIENQDVESKEVSEKEKASTISIEDEDVELKDVSEEKEKNAELSDSNMMDTTSADVENKNNRGKDNTKSDSEKMDVDEDIDFTENKCETNENDRLKNVEEKEKSEKTDDKQMEVDESNEDTNKEDENIKDKENSNECMVIEIDDDTNMDSIGKDVEDTRGAVVIASTTDENSENTSENKEDGSGNEEIIEISSEEVTKDDESNDKVSTDLTDADTNKDDSYMDDSGIHDENSIFVQVNTDKDDSEKSTSGIEQVSTDIDPIGSSEWGQSADPTFIFDLDEADECIIPDTNREENISVESSKEMDATKDATPLPTTSTDNKLSEKYLVSITNVEEPSLCMICDEKKVCIYNCSKDENKTNICSEKCLAVLKVQHPDNVIVRQLRVKNFSLDKDLQMSDDMLMGNRSQTGSIKCMNCGSTVTDLDNSLSWEAFDFCDEDCLTKHQKLIGTFCASCNIEVKENFLGKYCVRFGHNVRQFCSSTCLEEYKKGSRVCSFCQDDISGHTSGFLTSIGDRGSSKDFCSAQCMQNHNQINKHLKGVRITHECCVCHKYNPIEIEFDYKHKINRFCSEPCFVAFKYVNDVTPERCDLCCKYYMSLSLTQNLIRYDGVLRKFCQKTCQNIYVTTNRKIVSCCWCKVKKYNFDMIQKYCDGNVLIVCSLTCLNFFNASISVTKFKKKRCDFCHKISKGQYHITLADDSMKNFCSYPCVQEYQNKYLLAPARYSDQPMAMPSTTVSRITRKSTGTIPLRKQIIPDLPGPLPIITSVRSLAPNAGQSMSTRSLRSKSSASTITTITTLQAEQVAAPSMRKVIVLRPPDAPQQRNIATLVRPITADAEAEFKPIMVDKAVQTEDLKDSIVLVPLPVPIYIPSPMQMFNLIHPIPFPFPLPIPIPMFIPVTKQTANVVLKETKVRTPTDPYEADLLMMAELVAGEAEKKEPTEVDAECENEGETPAETPFSPEVQDTNNTFGEDMLQMALKMASDFDEPAVDLEGALTASTITATPASTDASDDVPPIQPPVERAPFRGRRRGRPPRHGCRRRGRGRPPTRSAEIVRPIEPEPPQPPPPSAEPSEKPDANMCLKYTFGVNAWKQWVTTKNAELEKASRRPKLFKPDLLQLTSDELNYSLCLFVKEVRKPNGAEYAPDTIYYLCLGIQQYLFENGRIDNIFCDSYYESFTDCLDEVCKKFSTLYNDSQYIVTRVEEEHLWESKQLGAHSPHVLLSTLIFFNTKHFNLTNVDEHMQLSFSHIMKHWKRVPNQPSTPKNSATKNVLLRFYPPQSAIEGNNRKKKVYEQQENEKNPLRCPVKLYEFYVSKCPESVKTRNDVFYLLPERSCVPDSPVWYSTMALGREALEKMFHRVKMVKEINVALLAS